MQPTEKSFSFEGFILDLRRGCLRSSDGEIELRPKSFEVLRYLVENAGRLVPKDEIMSAVWPDVVVSDESLARCVSDVRLALGDREQRIIKTVPRRGYLFAVPASEAEADLMSAAVAASVSTASLPESAYFADAHTDATSIDSPGSHGGTAPREQRVSERRLLTVMACEYVGLAALSTQLDAEDLRIVVAACRQHFADIIDRNHGHVARHLEDGVLVYFGYPSALEDDAEHAVRAGLSLLGSMEGLSRRLRTRMQLRIGVASGVVVVTEEAAAGHTKEVTAVGETPHLAKQLQLAADAGYLVIDQNTRRLVRGLFEYRDIGRSKLDGRPEVASAWRVLGPSRANNRFEARRGIGSSAPEQTSNLPSIRSEDRSSNPPTAGGLSPFVGRLKEFEILEGCLVETSTDVRVIDVVGEAGIGKSRLIHEFRSRLTGSRVRVWSANCWPGNEQMAFRPFIEIVRYAFALGADPEAKIIRKLELGLASVGLATAENLGLLLNLLGLKPPVGSLRGLDDLLVGLRTRDLLLQLVREVGRLTQILIVLEDLHWIDNASQDLLARLIETPDAGGVAIIHTRRPDYSPPWMRCRNTTTLALEPLAASETSQIVRARLGVPELTGALARLITDRAEGNPLFAEEIANFLIEGGMVRHRAGTLEYDTAAVAAAVPDSVQSLLTARVDRLPPGDRALLQAASAIGRRFSPELLAAVIYVEHAETRLTAMESVDLIRFDGSKKEFLFKHALVRDTLYASLLTGARQTLHLEIARELEHLNKDRIGEVAESLAYHYSRADHKEKAIEYLTLVGRKALRIYSLNEGEHSLRTALTMARANDSEHIDNQIATIMVDLAVVYYLQYRAADTIALIAPELGRIATLGDSRQAAILLDLYGVALFTSCHFREARRMAEMSLAIADRVGDRRSLAHARAGVIMMSVYTEPMSLADFEQFARRAHCEAEEGEDTYTVVRLTMVIANNYLHRGLVREGRQWAYQLMNFGRNRRDRRAQGMALWLLGWLDIIAEDFTSALAHGEECVQTALAPYDQQWGRHVIGISQLLLGRVAEGIETIRQHREHAIANGWQYAALVTEAPLGVSLLLSGKLRKGVRSLESLIGRCEREYRYLGYADWTRVLVAEFYIALIEGSRKPPLRVVLRNLPFLIIAKWTAAKKAEALLQLAIQNPQFSDRGVVRARINFNLGLVYKALGRRDFARTHLADARKAAMSQEATPLVAKIDTAMASLGA